MRFAAKAQLVLEHELCVWHVAITLGDLLERRGEEWRIVCVAKHAVLLVDQGGRFRFGMSGADGQH